MPDPRIQARRHDLLILREQGWRDLLTLDGEVSATPGIEAWAKRGYPVIVRRPTMHELSSPHATGGVPAAICFPPRHDPRRIGFFVPASSIERVVAPPLLIEVMKAAPRTWWAAMDDIIRRSEALGLTPRLFGSLMWQYCTGQVYVTPRSDLDLLWRLSPGDEAKAFALGAILEDIESRYRIPLDGEIVFPENRAVNWREFSRASSPEDNILVKSEDGIGLVTRRALLQAAMDAVQHA